MSSRELEGKWTWWWGGEDFEVYLAHVGQNVCPWGLISFPFISSLAESWLCCTEPVAEEKAFVNVSIPDTLGFSEGVFSMLTLILGRHTP